MVLKPFAARCSRQPRHSTIKRYEASLHAFFLIQLVTIRVVFRLLLWRREKDAVFETEMTREESISFYKTHAKRLYNVSLRIVMDSALAEEITQDTILKFMSLDPMHRQQVSELQVKSWLTKTCIRASIDELRKRKREKRFLEEYSNEEAPLYFAPVETPDNTSGSDTSSLDLVKVRKAIDDLKDPYRLILNLVLIDGLDYEEISSITGEREGTIRTQYSRARKMLQELLRNTTI